MEKKMETTIGIIIPQPYELTAFSEAAKRSQSVGVRKGMLRQPLPRSNSLYAHHSGVKGDSEGSGGMSR